VLVGNTRFRARGNKDTMASTKKRLIACSASVSAFLGAAAALVPASCGGNVQTENTGAGGTGSTTSHTGPGSSGTTTGMGGNANTGGFGGNANTGGPSSSSGMGTGGMMIHDAGNDFDGTLIDLDGQADAPYHPPEGGDGDADHS
jgi:hypothetical protein